VNNPGYIYILSNPAMPGILKIGRSSRGGSARASECYAGATGVPSPFRLVFEIVVNDLFLDRAEEQIHDELSLFRVNSQREFFKVQESIAVKVVARHALKYYGLYVLNGLELDDEIDSRSDGAQDAGDWVPMDDDTSDCGGTA